MTFHLSENSDLWPDSTSYYCSLTHTPHIRTNKAKKKISTDQEMEAYFNLINHLKKLPDLNLHSKEH